MGKIRKNIDQIHYHEKNYIVESEEKSSVINEKNFTRNDPHSRRNFFKDTESKPSSMLPRENSIERKRVDSSAVFRKNPGPAVYERTRQNYV